MRAGERDRAHVVDMIHAAGRALVFLGDRNAAGLEADAVLLAAIEHELIVLGEAARRISGGFRQRHESIPWGRIAGMRNVLVHEYGDVDVGEVWRTVAKGLPELLDQLESL
ncbi:MAG TPA: HepT-like ribonuclease domain-containing protein [Gaiellaceae bacterium]